MGKPHARAHGEGCITARKNKAGKIIGYEAALYVGKDPNGKMLRWRQFHKKRRDAADALSDAIRRKREGQRIAGPHKTVGQFLGEWLERVAKHTTEARTYHGYETLLRLHVLPVFDALPLDRLTPQDIQGLYAEKLKKLSPRRVHHLHACLHNALEVAVKWGLLNRNPAGLADAPKVPKRERLTLHKDHAWQFVAAARQRLTTVVLPAQLEDTWPALWITTICTALRQGEVLNLKWPDIHLESEPYLQLTTARTRVPMVGLVEKSPKSGKGRRVPLIPLVVEALEAHRDIQASIKCQAGAAWHETGLVFAGETGEWLNEWDVLRAYRTFLDATGLPRLGFHDLRHSCATLLLSAGVDIKTISTILGHSSIGITMDTYAHYAPQLGEDAMRKLERLLRPSPAE